MPQVTLPVLTAAMHQPSATLFLCPPPPQVLSGEKKKIYLLVEWGRLFPRKGTGPWLP